jgi:hypothetical protein
MFFKTLKLLPSLSDKRGGERKRLLRETYSKVEHAWSRTGLDVYALGDLGQTIELF